MRTIRFCLAALACALSLSGSSRELPKAPPGVAEIKLGELIQGPVGSGGLIVSEKAKSLDGKRVRIVGHVVRREQSDAGSFLLAPVPVQLHDDHYGLADDLPATTVFVSAPPKAKGVALFKGGLVVVTGALSVGNREEADGRISLFRIEADSKKGNRSRFAKFITNFKRQNASKHKH